MFSKHLAPILFLGVFLINTGCDPTTTPADPAGDAPYIQSLSVDPNSVVFSSATDGFKDTTLTFNINAGIQNVDLVEEMGFVLRDRETEQIIEQGELLESLAGQGSFYGANFQIETTTTSFEEYSVEVYAYDEFGSGNYFQSGIVIEGASNEVPVILWANNPSEVQRPTSGTTLVSFTAKATDPEGQNSIDGVFMRLISQVSGEVSNSPFRMYDDGSSGSDQIAQDSVFTVSFNIDPTNKLETYDIEYFAIDLAGLVSDTVRTTFSIVEN